MSIWFPFLLLISLIGFVNAFYPVYKLEQSKTKNEIIFKFLGHFSNGWGRRGKKIGANGNGHNSATIKIDQRRIH